MKKIISSIALMSVVAVSNAQTTALDFNRMDCNGNMRHLFTDLDSGKVVILEYFMGPNCTACEDAAKEIEGLKNSLLTKYPGKIMSYAMGFQNSYSCATIKTWVSNLGISAIPMDSAATQVAYYGGFAMPTIAVVAGTGHKILYMANASNAGYSKGDTSKIRTEINKFLNPTGITGKESKLANVSIFPNPVSDFLNIEFYVKETTDITIQIVDITGSIEWEEVNNKVPIGDFRKRIPISQFVPGSYISNVKENNNITSRHTIIVTK